MSTFLDRLKIELSELHDKSDKLNAFINTSTFLTLPSDQRRLLSEQIVVMTRYEEILQERINLLA